MRLLFYLFIFSQLLHVISAFADKDKKESLTIDSIKWEKIQGKKSNNLKNIIWEFQKDFDIPFEDKNFQKKSNKNFSNTEFIPLNKNDKLLLFGGVISDSALFPERGGIQISFNLDDKGNLFVMYGYSLSNIFQLEIDIGSFNNVNLVDDKNFKLKDTYLSQNNFNYRVGGKLLIFSPQKNDTFWLTLRTTLGRNNENKQEYLFSELISTFRFNDYLAFNVSPKYFFSGVKSFGGVGFSSYINLSDKLMLIPEIKTSIINDSDFNSSLALRYSFNQRKSVDLYYSNALGIQDIGQLLVDKNHRLGIKLNFLY